MYYSSKPPAKTATFPRAFAHEGIFYKCHLTPRVYSEARAKPYGWGILREEQLGCEVARALLGAEIGIDGKRVVRKSVARALYATACYGFNGGEPELHISGREPSYRNVRLPRIDLNPGLTPQDRQAVVIDRLHEQTERGYPALFRDIERKGALIPSRIARNARILGECALELAAVPLAELHIPAGLFDVQNFAAMAANSLKTDVSHSIASDQVTPSIRQFIRRGSPAMHELMGSQLPEVSDLAWEICRDL